jgi:ATP-dependent Clp protease ATP-binding subunit ClpC
MTSNIGASEIARNTPLGFSVGDATRHDVRRHEEPGHGRAQEGLPARVPQPHRRRDRVPQAAEERDQADRRPPAARIRGSLAERELQLDLTEAAEDFLVEKGWDPAMGARPLRRAIQRYIEDPLADFVLRSELVTGATVLVEQAAEESEEELKISIVKPEERPTPVGVGARKEGEPEEPGIDDGGALDQPAVQPPDPGE